MKNTDGRKKPQSEEGKKEDETQPRLAVNTYLLRSKDSNARRRGKRVKVVKSDSEEDSKKGDGDDKRKKIKVKRILKKPVPWSCSECTFGNKATRKTCAICATNRPTERQLSEPDDYHTNDNEDGKPSTDEGSDLAKTLQDDDNDLVTFLTKMKHKLSPDPSAPWTCAQCTFQNEFTAAKCSMCQQERACEIAAKIAEQPHDKESKRGAINQLDQLQSPGQIDGLLRSLEARKKRSQRRQIASQEELSAARKELQACETERVNQEAKYAEVQKELEERRRNSARKKEEQDCVVCADARRTIAFEPCGHLATCARCAPQFAAMPCPICRVKVEKCLVVYT